jgi:transcriptional regulator with XRE-family HTH domain
VIAFKDWFEQRYIDWMSKRGRRGSVREFSELLGVNQSVVANWIGGHRKPSPEHADKIAIFLDYDLTVYDLLEMPRPDRDLLRIKALYPTMNERERADVKTLLDKIERRTSHEQTATIPNAKPAN